MKQVEPELVLPRWRDTDEPALAELVAGLRENRPDVTELASLASQLAVRGIGVTTPDVNPPAPASAAWKKWLLAGGGAVAGVLVWLSVRAPVPPPPAAPASPRSAPARQAFAPATRPLPAVSPPAVGISSAPDLAVRPPAAPDGMEPERSDLAPSPTSAPESARTPSEPREPTAEVGARAPSKAAAVRPASPEASSATAVPTEIELLRDARLALKQSPARALELAESHARTYPNGKLTQERELMAITALVALGRRTAALSRASRFEQSFPQSPYRKQIGELLR